MKFVIYGFDLVSNSKFYLCSCSSKDLSFLQSKYSNQFKHSANIVVLTELSK